jgi:beta-1,4-mannosyltransferase
MRADGLPIVVQASATRVRIADSYHRCADGEEHVARCAARVTVVVLGDLGRSPRMCYHALALADGGVEVDLVGYVETAVDLAVARHPRIRVHALRAPAAHAPRRWFVLRGVLRVLRQSVELLTTLLRCTPSADTILVQSPPAIPTLAVGLLVARLRRAWLVVDWHNFGYAMLIGRLGPGHPLLGVARAYERGLGRRADGHLVVSRAMATELAANWGIPDAIVLPDRPAARFAPLSDAERAAVRARLAAHLDVAARPRGPALVVSPSGWTADEDVDLLVDALQRYDQAIADAPPTVPDLLVVVTGLGPLRDAWLPRIALLPLRRVLLRTLWLDAEQYPRVVAAADLGVSVHRSTSGFDLPMKIADLQGAGVPVCALDYAPCLGEMIRDGDNGLLFRSAAELAEQLQRLFGGESRDDDLLGRLRAGTARGAGTRWHETWAETAGPLLRRAHA